ncbi:hypothetical protein DUI70_3589 [Streptomyces albus]|nr:hypothetical protein DUI70_3589 [Streptomyces albus]
MTTPPQGQNPFAQTPPQGQPQGGNPYGQQGPAGGAQAPYPQGGQAPYPQQGGFRGAPVPPPADNRKKKIKFIAIGAAVLIAGGAIIAGIVSGQDDANTAAVGDCMHRGSMSDTNPDLEVVDCGGKEAQYKVTAKVKGSYSTREAASGACSKETKDFDNYYTERGGSGDDFLLCLSDLKK